ncbi:unnamed protein product [Cutaneotrichosporon oleaginosum]
MPGVNAQSYKWSLVKSSSLNYLYLSSPSSFFFAFSYYISTRISSLRRSPLYSPVPALQA